MLYQQQSTRLVCKMGHPETDVEAIFEECLVQNITVQKSVDQKTESERQYRELMQKLKDTLHELNEKNKILSEYKLLLTENVQKLFKIHEKNNILNKKTQDTQGKIKEISADIEKHTNEFMASTTNTEKRLNNLYLQFEEERLREEIKISSEKLLYFQQTEKKLKHDYGHLKNTQIDLESYKILHISNLIPDTMEMKSIQDFEKDILDVKKNTELYKQKTQELLNKLG